MFTVIRAGLFKAQQDSNFKELKRILPTISPIKVKYKTLREKAVTIYES